MRSHGMGSGHRLVTYGIPTVAAAAILAATVVVPGRSDANVAPRVAPLAAPAALSGIGTSDFQLGFTIRTTAAIINQRARCEHGTFILHDVCDGADGTGAIRGTIANVSLTLPRR